MTVDIKEIIAASRSIQASLATKYKSLQAWEKQLLAKEQDLLSREQSLRVNLQELTRKKNIAIH